MATCIPQWRQGPSWAAQALCGAVLLGLVVTGQAALSPLTVEMQPLTLRPRTAAPAYVDIKLHSQSRTPLEGTLELQLWSEGDLLFRQEVPDLTLPYGVTHRRVLLPPPLIGRRFIEEVRLKFSTHSAVYDLGRFPTAGASMAARQYLIGICHSGTGISERQSLIWQALRPDRLTLNATSHLVSAPVWFLPDDLPPLIGLCAFDIIVLEGPALAALGQTPLSDLTTWVEAGGSLCVISPSALDAEHLAFLNRLGGSAKTPEPFVHDPDGTVARSAAAGKSPAEDATFHFRKSKLGRFVIAFTTPSSEEQLKEHGWIKATHFLAHSDSEEKDLTFPQMAVQQMGLARLAVVQARLLENLPRAARMIPLPVVSVILGAFVLLVGPGEWFLLGKLRRRRWTWFTFPAIAAGCTIFTVRAAEYYLGKNDQQVALVITDFSPDGRPLRENRVELWFAGRNGEAASEMHQALTVPAQDEARYSRTGTVRLESIYQGHVPAHYTLRHELRQWTPYLQRTLNFAPNANTPRLRWEAMTKPPTLTFPVNSGAPAGAALMDVNTTTQPESHAAEKLAEQIGAQGWTVRIFQLGHLASVFPADYHKDSLAEALSIAQPPSSPQNFNRRFPQRPADPPPLWARACSPTGQPDLLDLALDHEDVDWVVVAERQMGREIQMQRCVYRFGSDE